MVRDHHIAFVGTKEEAKGSPQEWLQQFISGGEGILEKEF